MIPDDDYLRALGKSTYCIAYTEWLVMEVVQRLDRSNDVERSGATNHGHCR